MSSCVLSRIRGTSKRQVAAQPDAIVIPLATPACRNTGSQKVHLCHRRLKTVGDRFSGTSCYCCIKDQLNLEAAALFVEKLPYHGHRAALVR